MHLQEALKDDNFLTIKAAGEGMYKEKGSKFIGYAYPATSVEQALAYVNELKARHHDARHWCFAYRINPQKPEVRANDDGEPSNSAGMPIYNQIVSADLWNVVVVVIRYFGGTKLGVSGLIGAYKEGAALAIEDARIFREFRMEEIEIHFPYALMNEVMRLVKEMDVTIVEEKMGTTAGYLMAIRRDHFDKLLKKIEQMHEIKIQHNIS